MKLTQNQVREIIRAKKEENKMSWNDVSVVSGIDKNRINNWMASRVNFNQEEINNLFKKMNIINQDIERIIDMKFKEKNDIKEQEKTNDLSVFKNNNGVTKIPDGFENPYKDDINEEEYQDISIAREVFCMHRGCDLPEMVNKRIFNIRARNFLDSSDNFNESGALLFNGEMLRIYTGIKEVKKTLMLIPVPEYVKEGWVYVVPQLILDEDKKEYMVFIYHHGIENIRIYKGDIIAQAIVL